MPHLHDLLRDYGYFFLFVVVLVENFGIPAPGQTLLIATAVLAAQGKLNIVLVLGLCFSAAFIGDCIGYWIGQKGGRRLILRFGRYVRVGEPEVARMEAAFGKYGIWFVAFARFFEVLRQLNGIVAGTAGMRLRSFLIWNAVGAALWTGVWGLGSWKLGRHIQDYESLFEQTGNVLVLLLILALLALLVWFVRHRLKNHRKR